MDKRDTLAREGVLDILCDNSKVFKKELIERYLRNNCIPAKDRNFIVELTNGVMKRLATLKNILEKYSHRKNKNPKVNNALFMGMYQLLFMDKVPAYAAINTTVELLKRSKLSKQARFANALLRTIQRETQCEALNNYASNVLPFGEKAWIFKRDIFPSPEKNIQAYYASVYSYPLELVKKWCKEFGEEKAKTLFELCNKAPQIFIRPRQDTDLIKKQLDMKNVDYTSYGNLFEIKHFGKYDLAHELANGSFVISGPVATRAIETLEIKPGMKVLDMCAAPGGKSLYIADLLKNDGSLLSCDISYRRIKSLRKIQKKWNISLLSIIVLDGTKLPSSFYNYFDRVVIDAPCSNSGVFGKRVEARWRFHPENIRNLNTIQYQLLNEGAKTLKDNGKILYSTCSIEKEENEAIIEQFIKQNPDFRVILKKRNIPTQEERDGGTFFNLLRQTRGLGS